MNNAKKIEFCLEPLLALQQLVENKQTACLLDCLLSVAEERMLFFFETPQENLPGADAQPEESQGDFCKACVAGEAKPCKNSAMAFNGQGEAR